MSMLERGVGGAGPERLFFHGRPQFPERLHVVALVLDVTTRLLADLEAALRGATEEVKNWPSTNDERITPMTRKRLERIRDPAQEGAPPGLTLLTLRVMSLRVARMSGRGHGGGRRCAQIVARGGSVKKPPWLYPRPGSHGDEPPVIDWAVMQDPFGNEFCLVSELAEEEIAAVLAATKAGASTDREWRLAAGRTGPLDDVEQT